MRVLALAASGPSLRLALAGPSVVWLVFSPRLVPPLIVRSTPADLRTAQILDGATGDFSEQSWNSLRNKMSPLSQERQEYCLLGSVPEIRYVDNVSCRCKDS